LYLLHSDLKQIVGNLIFKKQWISN